VQDKNAAEKEQDIMLPEQRGAEVLFSEIVLETCFIDGSCGRRFHIRERLQEPALSQRRARSDTPTERL